LTNLKFLLVNELIVLDGEPTPEKNNKVVSGHPKITCFDIILAWRRAMAKSRERESTDEYLNTVTLQSARFSQH